MGPFGGPVQLLMNWPGPRERRVITDIKKRSNSSFVEKVFNSSREIADRRESRAKPLRKRDQPQSVRCIAIGSSLQTTSSKPAVRSRVSSSPVIQFESAIARRSTMRARFASTQARVDCSKGSTSNTSAARGVFSSCRTTSGNVEQPRTAIRSGANSVNKWPSVSFQIGSAEYVTTSFAQTSSLKESRENSKRAISSRSAVAASEGRVPVRTASSAARRDSSFQSGTHQATGQKVRLRPSEAESGFRTTRILASGNRFRSFATATGSYWS